MSTVNLKKIFTLYEEFGARDYVGEPVSQIEHMIQAAMLAEDDNQSPGNFNNSHFTIYHIFRTNFGSTFS